MIIYQEEHETTLWSSSWLAQSEQRDLNQEIYNLNQVKDRLMEMMSEIPEMLTNEQFDELKNKAIQCSKDISRVQAQKSKKEIQSIRKITLHHKSCRDEALEKNQQMIDRWVNEE